MSAGFTPGDRVVDQDDDDPDTAAVVATPDATADEWDVDGKTVATFPGNEDYPGDAPVVVVVFLDELERAGIAPYHGPDPLDLSALAAETVAYYAFPAPRLELVESAPEPGQDLLAIAERLRGGGMSNVEVDAGEGVVRGTKLGEEYVVDGDGHVQGGAIADRVAKAVAEVVR